MKKVAFMFVAAMAISFASCGGQTAANTESGDTTSCEGVVEEIEKEVVDTLAADSAIAEVGEEAAVVAE